MCIILIIPNDIITLMINHYGIKKHAKGRASGGNSIVVNKIKNINVQHINIDSNYNAYQNIYFINKNNINVLLIHIYYKPDLDNKIFIELLNEIRIWTNIYGENNLIIVGDFNINTNLNNTYFNYLLKIII